MVFLVNLGMKRGLSHLIDVGVPHLAQEPEGRWGVWVINRELDQSLQHRTGND